MAGAVPRAIAFTAMDVFARRHGIADDDFDDFRAVIRAIDAAWMAELNRQRPKAPPPKAGATSSGGRAS